MTGDRPRKLNLVPLLRFAGLALLLSGCGKSLDLDTQYSGLLSSEITGGPGTVQGSARYSANLTHGDSQFTIALRSCHLVFDVVDLGQATLNTASRCTIDPEVDGGQTFAMISGTATFGGGTIGVNAQGQSNSGPERLDITFAGQKR